jgi:hypothetical protein
MTESERGMSEQGGTNERNSVVNDIKYLSDGRKVSVIGRLNQSELIVQEVFVKSDGGEIPSGENFVVKSVHDEPVQSWHEKKCAEMESKHEELQAKLQAVGDELKDARTAATERAKALRSFASNACGEALATLEAFVSGEITHVVISGYRKLEIKTFESMDLDVENYSRQKSIEGMKLLCLFGKSDGSLSWRISQYRDHSGSWCNIIPCRSYAEAVDVAQRIYDDRVDAWRNGKQKQPPSDNQKISELVLDGDAVKYWTKHKEQKRQERIAKLRDELNALLEESE